jgi:hypothetical protein
MSGQTLVPDQSCHLNFSVERPVSVEQSCLVMTGADVPGGGPVGTTEKTPV